MYTLIQKQGVDNGDTGVTSVDFTNITADYNEYLFTLTHVKPMVEGKEVYFQVDTGELTNYDQDITSTRFTAGHRMNDGWSLLEHNNGQQTGDAMERMAYSASADNDNSNWFQATQCGFLRLYDPSDGTFMKHFQSIVNCQYTGNGTAAQTYTMHWASQGYVHTPTALTRVRFQAETGNLQHGQFALYGLS